MFFPKEDKEASSSSMDLLNSSANLQDLRVLDASLRSEAKVLAASTSGPPLPPSAGQFHSPLFRRKTKCTQFRKVGLDRPTSQLRVLVPSETDKELHARQLLDWLQTDLIEMKKLLIECHLMKHGSNAREETIRTLFMAVKQVGVVKNTNLTTQWHNYNSESSSSYRSSSSEEPSARNTGVDIKISAL